MEMGVAQVTNEEAIKWIEKAGDYSGLLPSEFWHDNNGSPYYEAIDMAIAALKAENKKAILYICDRKKCNQGECPNPECFHTTDPDHRRREGGSPSIFVEDQDGNLWEKYHIEIKEGERNE